MPPDSDATNSVPIRCCPNPPGNVPLRNRLAHVSVGADSIRPNPRTLDSTRMNAYAPGAKRPRRPWKGRWLSVSETGGVCPSTERVNPSVSLRLPAPLSGAPLAKPETITIQRITQSQNLAGGCYPPLRVACSKPLTLPKIPTGISSCGDLLCTFIGRIQSRRSG